MVILPPIFKTVETSNPRFGIEGLRFATVHSPALAQRAELTFLFARGGDGICDLSSMTLYDWLLKHSR